MPIRESNKVKQVVGWSVEQLANAAKLDKSRINQLIHTGAITAYLVSKTYVIRNHEALAFLEDRKRRGKL